MSALRASMATLLALSFGLSLAVVQAAEPDPEAVRLGQRLQTIDIDPQRNGFAAYERLQARQAVQALQTAKRKQKPQALQIARIRVETAEIASRTESGGAELQRLEIERAELLVEASRRDAERARAEAERLRIEARIQAEETTRLREAVDAEARNREEAEGLLDSVAGGEAEKLRLAREREAELARREAELLGGGPVSGGTAPRSTATPKPKQMLRSTPKPKPRPKPTQR